MTEKTKHIIVRWPIVVKNVDNFAVYIVDANKFTYRQFSCNATRLMPDVDFDRIRLNE